MWSRILVKGRDTHQPLDGESVKIAAASYKSDRLPRLNAGLLRFCTCVHLYIESRRLALFPDFGRNRSRDLLPVDRFDHIEQGHGLPYLVGLQRADEVKLQIGEFRFQSRPFALRLLDAVFAE